MIVFVILVAVTIIEYAMTAFFFWYHRHEKKMLEKRGLGASVIYEASSWGVAFGFGICANLSLIVTIAAGLVEGFS